MLKSLNFSFGMFLPEPADVSGHANRAMDFLRPGFQPNRFEVDLAEFAKEDHERMAWMQWSPRTEQQ